MASHLWKFIRDLVSSDTVGSSKDAAEAVLGLAEALAAEGDDRQKLGPLIAQLTSLQDALGAPLQKIAGTHLSFVPIGTGLLQFYSERTKQEPTLAQCVALVSQVAYLETVKALLNQPRLKAWLAAVGNRPASESTQQKLKVIGAIELGDIEARQTLLSFPESKLAKIYGEILVARLVELGAPLKQANQVTAQLAQVTSRLLLSVLMKYSDRAQALVKWHRTQGDVVVQKYLGIDTYLEEWIAPRPHASVFAESFTLKDVYTPLKAQPLTRAGAADTTQEPVFLEEWAQQMLNDEAQKDQVRFVEGETGRGKSIFCQMFADWVYRHEYPRWIPILIRLQDVTAPSEDFEEILAAAVNRDFTKTDSNWLADPNLNFLFLLDGFDELIGSGINRNGRDLLDQAGWFQQRCARDSEMGHRVLITGRPLGLQETDHRTFNNLLRVAILPLDSESQWQWFNRWGALTNQDPAHLMQTFQDPRLPESIRKLSQEPLLLCILAAMHRDGELQLEKLAEIEAASFKFLIYAHALHWLLRKQHPEWSQIFTQWEPTRLRLLLQEASLYEMQLGVGATSFRVIENRLAGDGATAEILTVAQNLLETSNTPLRNGLASFYLQSGQSGEGKIEFIHRSFKEFLCAERIVSCLIGACQPRRDRDEDGVTDHDFCWMMYDLFGCPVLTSEIIEFLTALLTTHPEFKFEQLHQRLYDFYWRWSHGEFIDTYSETLPQQKMQLLEAEAQGRVNPLGQCQIDLYVGLNTLILLWELHRYGLAPTEWQTSPDTESFSNPFFFHPCAHPNRDPFDAQRLLRIIGMSQCLGITVFRSQMGHFLRGVNLRGADLSGADLSHADLSHADLRSTRLVSADFSHANFSHADLTNADLSGSRLVSIELSRARVFSADFSKADLREANFSFAKLNRANFSDANLCNADFSGTDLIRVNFSRANLSNANLSDANLGRANFSDADLRRANLNGADLSYANFCNANLGSADLRGANLSDAILDGVNLNSADLRNANLRGANLSRADLRNVDFEEANLIGANLFAVKLFEADLRNADLGEVNLFRAKLGGASFTEANLRNTDLSHADLFETILSGADLSYADLFEANLSRTNLSDASLSGADLRSANLSEASLSKANLVSADLFNANLSSVDLRGANLGGTNLVGANLTNAILSDGEEGVKWDENTQWEGVKGLEYAIGIPETLLQQLGLVRQ